jgi:hypothetical protein
MLIGRTDCGGHLPFQIDCGEEPDTSAVGLSDVVEQQRAVRVQKEVAMMEKLDDNRFVQIQLLEVNADVRARSNDAQKMLVMYKMPPRFSLLTPEANSMSKPLFLVQFKCLVRLNLRPSGSASVLCLPATAHQSYTAARSF